MKRLPVNIVPKDWGSEEWIVNNDLYCGKILRINAGHFSSWHYHKLKTETFRVLKGILGVRYSLQDELTDANYVYLQPGDCMDIPIGMRHRLTAINGDVEFIEISTHHEDSDSYRLINGA